MESVSPAYSRLARVTLILFALNAFPQVFDGVATYIGCSLGMVEGNPMVAYVMAGALLEKLGGDSLEEMRPRFADLRRGMLNELDMDNEPWRFAGSA